MDDKNGNIETAKDEGTGNEEAAMDEELVVKSEKRMRAGRKESGKGRKWLTLLLELDLDEDC